MRRCGLPAQGPGPSGQAGAQGLVPQADAGQGRQGLPSVPPDAQQGPGNPAWQNSSRGGVASPDRNGLDVLRPARRPGGKAPRRVRQDWTRMAGAWRDLSRFPVSAPALAGGLAARCDQIEPRGEDRALIPRETVGIPDFAGDARRIALVSTRGFHAISRFSCGIDGSPRAIDANFTLAVRSCPELTKQGQAGRRCSFG